MSSAPLRSSEKWSGGFFGGCYVPLPGAQRGHLICRVIDKCGRGVAVPTSPPPAPVLLPSSLSAPSLLPARSAARWRAAPVGICLPLGAPPALAAVPPLPGAPVRGCAGSRASRLADAAGASGGSCGWRAHRVSSLHSGTPRSTPCLSRPPPLVGVGGRMRKAWARSAGDTAPAAALGGRPRPPGLARSETARAGVVGLRTSRSPGATAGREARAPAASHRSREERSPGRKQREWPSRLWAPAPGTRRPAAPGGGQGGLS